MMLLQAKGCQKDCNKSPEAKGDAWYRLSLTTSKGTNRAHTLILEFWHPGNTFLLF